MRMTFDEYDAMLMKFDSKEIQALKPCWPSHKTFTTEYLAHPEKYIPVCCFLLEKMKTSDLNEEKMRYLIQDFVYQNLELYDPDNEKN